MYVMELHVTCLTIKAILYCHLPVSNIVGMTVKFSQQFTAVSANTWRIGTHSEIKNTFP